MAEDKMKLDVDFDKKREISVGDSGRVRFRFRDIAVEPGKAVSLKNDFDPDFTGGYDDKAGALEKAFGDMSVDEGQINRENSAIAQGAQLPINTFDDHQSHIEGHTEFQKGATYSQLGPEIARNMEQHVALHREQVMKPAAPVLGRSSGLCYF